MRIVHLTPGTGSFYCGTCLRDRTLVRALRARGHAVSLVPMYLPSFPEEKVAPDEAPIRMGAVNLYLQQKLPAVRLLPRPLTHLLDSPRLLRWISRRTGSTDPVFLGEMTISMLQGERGRLGPAVEELAGWCAREDPPADVVLLSNALLLGMARRVRERTGAAVVCTLQGEAPYLDALPEPQRGIAWQTLRERAPDADALVAVSRSYADLMAERLGLAAESVGVVWNGLDAEELSAAPRRDAPTRPALGFLARMCEDKGLSLLVEAFIRLRQRGRVPDLALRVAGVQRPEDRARVEGLRQRLAEAGLGQDAEFRPDIGPEAKRELLGSLTVMSVPAAADESFGLYLLEAMAAGVPVVQPRHAAFPEILDATGGGILCEPDDPQALAEAIEGLLLDEPRARRLGEQGQRAVRSHFTADRMALEVEALLRELVDSKKGDPAR